MITLISGTNRPNSQTQKVTQFLSGEFKRAGANNQILDLGDLPLSVFSPEAYAEKPREFSKFSDAVLQSKGLVVVTPEYNGSFPGVLKLFIDHLKFPESFENRPVGFVGVAAGMWGGLRSVEQLQMIFAYRNAKLFNERIFLPRIESQFGPTGELTSPLVKTLVDSFVKNFVKFSDSQQARS